MEKRLYYVGITSLAGHLHDLMYDINGKAAQAFISRTEARKEMETAWKLIKEKLGDKSDYNMVVLRDDDPRVVEHFKRLDETILYNLGHC